MADDSPLDPASFSRRVQTFDLNSWPHMPLALSPLICASHGWEVKNTGTLHCTFCQRILDIALPKLNIEFYEKVTQGYVDKLHSAHREACVWRRVACPRYFLTGEGEGETLEERLLPCAARLSEDKELLQELHLPAPEDAADLISSVAMQNSVDTQALWIAVHGWTIRSLTKEKILECTLCRRRLLLSCQHKNSGLAQKALDLVDHMPWCPWVHPFCQGEQTLTSRLLHSLSAAQNRKRKRDSLEYHSSEKRREEILEIRKALKP